MTSEFAGIFPPNTLFRLVETVTPGAWLAPGGSRPNQRLLVVSATFRMPLSGASNGFTGARMCEEVTTLTYGDREAFVTGLYDIIDSPLLTLEEEFTREIYFEDWHGQRHSLVHAMSHTHLSRTAQLSEGARAA